MARQKHGVGQLHRPESGPKRAAVQSCDEGQSSCALSDLVASGCSCAEQQPPSSSSSELSTRTRCAEQPSTENQRRGSALSTRPRRLRRPAPRFNCTANQTEQGSHPYSPAEGASRGVDTATAVTGKIFTTAIAFVGMHCSSMPCRLS